MSNDDRVDWPISCNPTMFVSSDGTLNVIASYVDSISIEYECMFCWKKYTSNGEPHKKSNRKVHFHGSGGDINVKSVTKRPHCDFSNEYVRKQYISHGIDPQKDVKIWITDATKIS